MNTVMQLMLAIVSAHTPPGQHIEPVLTAMRKAEPAWTSDELLQAVSGVQLDRTTSSIVAPRLIEAWEAHRKRPPIEVGELAMIFAAKRDGVASIDVTYSASLRRSAETTHWWVRWLEDESAVQRTVASTPTGLADPMDDPSVMTWRMDGSRMWFSRAGAALREVDPAGLSMVGIEDSWLGAGGCIGSRGAGTARAAEHDLGSMLAAGPAGTAIVESERCIIRGIPAVALRIGWKWPVWVYLDSSRGFAPVRIDRWMEAPGGVLLARTEMRGLKPLKGGLWLPTSIVLQQFPLEEMPANRGDTPDVPPELELRLEQASMRCNEPIMWEEVPPQWDSSLQDAPAPPRASILEEER